MEPGRKAGRAAPPARTFLAALLVLTMVPGCTFNLDSLRFTRAENAIGHQEYKKALGLLHEIIDREPDSPRALAAAQLGARVAHFELKSYGEAVDFYHLIILRSKDPEERLSAQKYIAQIEFENLRNFDQAVADYERLLNLETRPVEAFRFRLNLAKSHLQLNNIDQALNELNVLLDQKHSSDEMFEVQMLKASTLMNGKKLTEAATLWDTILRDYPERSRKENVALNLVVCYEEMKEFGRAISVLMKMRPGDPHPDFLDLRIQRLKDRMLNAPGAQGLKR